VPVYNCSARSQTRTGIITLALFVDAVDDENRAKSETVYEDQETGVTVRPVFVETET